MAYQALYRRWRPQTFESVVGQTATVKTLRHQIETGQIAHAYLFCGCRGTGKTTMAKLMSRAINCLNPNHGDPCGKCEVCRAIQTESTMDVLELDAASNNSVDNIRELLEQVRYPAQMGKYKVYIIDEVHMLSTASENAGGAPGPCGLYSGHYRATEAPGHHPVPGAAVRLWAYSVGIDDRPHEGSAGRASYDR